MVRMQVNEWSLLYTWRGTNSSLKPLLCISHLDVVPATAEAAWTQPPFGGSIKDG
jgi:carboxypeptidase PM20D1